MKILTKHHEKNFKIFGKILGNLWQAGGNSFSNKSMKILHLNFA